MKTKEEVIKEAWGKHWETLAERGKEQALEDSGYCNKNYVNSVLDCEIEVHSFPDTDFIRPKSLSGIENNNGWIRIESEEDLPKEDCECWIFFPDSLDIMQAYFTIDYNVFTRDGHGNLYQRCFTHYQPIVKPKPPIY